jgi:hypothetical protein
LRSEVVTVAFTMVVGVACGGGWLVDLR